MTQTVLLGDICIQITDGTHSTVRDNEDGDYYLLSAKNIKDRIIISDKERKIDAATLETLRKRTKTAKNDVLVTSVGTIGETAIIEDGSPNYEFQRSVLILKPNTDIVDPRYLYYYMRSLKNNFISMATGAVQKCLFIGQMKNVSIELPDLETQKKIAAILWTIDEKIELNRRVNETLEQMGQALFRHYFVDNPKAERWEKKTIGTLCDVKIGRTPPRKESEWFDKNDGEAWISIKDMGQGTTFISDSSEYLTEAAVAKFNVPAIEPNTLLLSFKLTVGRLCISTKRMYSNEAIAQLPLKSSEISVEYLYYFLRNFNFDQLSSTSSIATAVNSTTVKNIGVVVPNEAAMKDFTAQVHKILESVKNNETEIQTLTTLRDTLLPRLISGKVKV